MPRVCKSAKRYCPDCSKERAVKFFTKSPEICNFCYFSDKAAQITAPKD